MGKKDPEKYEENKRSWAKERIESKRRELALAAAAEVFRGQGDYMKVKVLETAREFEKYLRGPDLRDQVTEEGGKDDN